MKRRSVIGAIIGSLTLAGCGSRAETGEKSEISPTTAAQRTLKQGVSTKYQADLWEITGDRCVLAEGVRVVDGGSMEIARPGGRFWAAVELTVRNLAEKRRTAPRMSAFAFVGDGWAADPLSGFPIEGELRQREEAAYLKEPGYAINGWQNEVELTGGSEDYLTLLFDLETWPRRGVVEFEDDGETVEIGIERVVT